MQLNVKAHEDVGKSYRRAAVPPYLKNRPAWFISHCLQKKDLAEGIPKEDIQEMQDSFSVRSQDPGVASQTYKVSLGSESHHVLPSCECHVWQWTHLPCKHLFAVMAHCQGICWKSLPAFYRDCPLFVVDMAVLNIKSTWTWSDAADTVNSEEMAEVVAELDILEATHSDVEAETGEADTTGGNENVLSSEHAECKTGELPARKSQSSVEHIARLCREELGFIKDATYLCKDRAMLQDLWTRLHDASSHIKKGLSSEEGLPILPNPATRRKSRPPPVTRRKSHPAVSHPCKYKLSVWHKLKRNTRKPSNASFRGRVGEKARRARMNSRIQTPSVTASNNECHDFSPGDSIHATGMIDVTLRTGTASQAESASSVASPSTSTLTQANNFRDVPSTSGKEESHLEVKLQGKETSAKELGNINDFPVPYTVHVHT